MAAFSAVGSQEAWSKLSPRAPRKSARPTLSRRLFMVAMLAPRKTPRTPTYGFVESCAAALGVAAGAASWGVAVLTGLAPELFRASARANPDNDRQPRPQLLRNGLAREEHDFYGYALHNFREVAGGIVRRKQREL